MEGGGVQSDPQQTTWAMHTLLLLLLLLCLLLLFLVLLLLLLAWLSCSAEHWGGCVAALCLHAL
jgi:hypothetical protein